MPAYDFKCEACGKEFSVRVTVEDRDKVTCPDCGKDSVRQTFSACNINIGSSCVTAIGRAPGRGG